MVVVVRAVHSSIEISSPRHLSLATGIALEIFDATSSQRRLSLATGTGQEICKATSSPRNFSQATEIAFAR